MRTKTMKTMRMLMWKLILMPNPLVGKITVEMKRKANMMRMSWMVGLSNWKVKTNCKRIGQMVMVLAVATIIIIRMEEHTLTLVLKSTIQMRIEVAVDSGSEERAMLRI